MNPQVDIKQVISNSLAVIRAHGQHTNIKIHTDVSEDLPLIHGSSHQLEQVLVNVLLNALQSLPAENGQTTISATYDNEASKITIAVSDNGGGIDLPPRN